MWPFRRKAEAAPPAAAGPQPVPAPVIRRDWLGLPPIQRLIAEHPLTAPSERFSDDLATHQDPSLSADTMGHQVSAEAPAGIVLTLAHSRRMGLGARINRLPESSVQRTAGDSMDSSEPVGAPPARPEPAAMPLAPAAHPASSNAISRTPDLAIPMPEPEADLREAPSSPANLGDQPRLDLPLARRADTPEAAAAFPVETPATTPPGS